MKNKKNHRKVNPFHKFTDDELAALRTMIRTSDTWQIRQGMKACLSGMLEMEIEDRIDERIQASTTAIAIQ